ncbi:MAG TPA: hypothetical protein VMN36_13295 [Verrucomicrobiales bacterium]|nr:hypothetical protein [Verrucomicrobiales bacterium]
MTAESANPYWDAFLCIEMEPPLAGAGSTVSQTQSQCDRALRSFRPRESP